MSSIMIRGPWLDAFGRMRLYVIMIFAFLIGFAVHFSIRMRARPPRTPCAESIQTAIVFRRKIMIVRPNVGRPA